MTDLVTCTACRSAVTENTRASYPIDFIANARIPCIGPHPQNIILLCCDAFGVLPPVSKLTTAQAMYHFISGYTAKVRVSWMPAQHDVVTTRRGITPCQHLSDQHLILKKSWPEFGLEIGHVPLHIGVHDQGGLSCNLPVIYRAYCRDSQTSCCLCSHRDGICLRPKRLARI